MASFLLDTNLLVRLVEPSSPWRDKADRAVQTIVEADHEVCVTPQNIIEFWAVATRPPHANGLGWDQSSVEAEAKAILSRYTLLKDQATILEHWMQLVISKSVKGKRVHDARLVAVMLVHGIDFLLTFNTADFARYLEVKVVSPDEIILKLKN